MKRIQHPVPVISVGNVTVGGTGKTPMVEYLVRLLRETCRVAVVSRGYKRRSRGFRLVEVSDTALLAGDEPLQIKRKFPDVTVAVDKKRNRAISRLLEMPEEVRPEVVLLDDGFQYRRLQPSCNLVLCAFDRPPFRDALLPLGRLRESASHVCRADAVVVTKCPYDPDPEERAFWREKLRLGDDTPLFFTTLRYDDPLAVFPDKADRHYIWSPEALLLTGVANPTPLLLHLTDRYEFFTHRRFCDHHRYGKADARALARRIRSHPRTLLLTTEKDAVRLRDLAHLNPEVRKRLFYVPVSHAFFSGEEAESFANFICRREKNA